MFDLKPIVKGVASGIGLAHEASAAHKAHKAQKEAGKSPIASDQHLGIFSKSPLPALLLTSLHTSQSHPIHEANDDASGDSNLEDDEPTGNSTKPPGKLKARIVPREIHHRHTPKVSMRL
jgi:hypothetical protein